MQNHDYLDCLALPSSLYEKIEKDIVKLFVQQNIRAYPIDPVEIAVSLGYDLVSFSKMSKDIKRILISKDVDGISYYDPNRRKYIIYYRPDSMKERIRFTIGHEIGHIRMGHKGESELARRIADYYAAYLLAPTPWIARAGCEDYEDVAKTFFISEPCAMRCFNRYENWQRIKYAKSYEKNLMELLL